MQVSWQTDFSSLKIYNVSMHESVVMSFAHPPVFMVGSIKTILEGISHLWTSRPQDQECHIEELLNNLLAWYRPTWTSQLQISVKTK